MSIQISTKMRKKAYQGFFIITIISLAGVPTFFKLIFNTGQSIAVVDNMAVSPQEYRDAIIRKDNQLSALRSRLSGAGMQINDDILRSFGINTNVREAALDDLITEKLLAGVARSLNIHIHADYVAQVLRNPQMVYQLLGDSVPPYLFNAQGGIDAGKLKLFMQRQGKTIESFDATIETKMQQATVLNLVKEAAIVSSADLAAATLQKYAPKSFTVTIGTKITTVTTKPGKEHDKQLEQLKKDGIATERMERMFAKGQSFTGTTPTMSYKVELVDIGSVNQELAQKNGAAMVTALEQENEGQITYDFIASLREHAKIVMNTSLLKGM